MITLHLLCKTFFTFSHSQCHIFYTKTFLLFFKHNIASAVQQILLPFTVITLHFLHKFLAILKSSLCIFYLKNPLIFPVTTLHPLHSNFLNLIAPYKQEFFSFSTLLTLDILYNKFLTLSQSLHCLWHLFYYPYPFITLHLLHKFLTLSQYYVASTIKQIPCLF